MKKLAAVVGQLSVALMAFALIVGGVGLASLKKTPPISTQGWVSGVESNTDPKTGAPQLQQGIVYFHVDGTYEGHLVTWSTEGEAWGHVSEWTGKWSLDGGPWNSKMLCVAVEAAGSEPRCSPYELNSDGSLLWGTVLFAPRSEEDIQAILGQFDSEPPAEQPGQDEQSDVQVS
jgi:hypothetical protein